jgi:cyclic beta-1,2-glucan synthetase
MVVVPALLAGPADVDALFSHLELHFLSNSDPHLSFALLTDFTDAPQQDLPEDAELLALAHDGVEALNAKYAESGCRRSNLFHRRCLWNPAEDWLGWEQARQAGRVQLTSGDAPRRTWLRWRSGPVAAHSLCHLDADTALPWESALLLFPTLAPPQLRRAGAQATGVCWPRSSCVSRFHH